MSKKAKTVWRCHWNHSGKVCGYLITDAKDGRGLSAFIKGGTDASYELARRMAIKSFSHPAKVHLHNRTPGWIVKNAAFLFGMKMFPLDQNGHRRRFEPYANKGVRRSCRPVFAEVVGNRMMNRGGKLDVYLAGIAMVAWDFQPEWLRKMCHATNVRGLKTSGLPTPPITDQLGRDHGESAVRTAAA